MRLHLMRVAEAEYQLIWTSHHVLFDGWSIPILLNEVFAIYGALSRHEVPRLAPARPYRDHIAWLQRQDMEAAEHYWRGRLAGFETPTVLGLGRPAAAAARDRYAEHECQLPVALTELEAFARRHKLTVNTLVQGAWALLLGRYGDSEDVVFGVTVAGRPAELPEVERTVGLFINTLPLRLALPPGQKVTDWLHDVQARQTELSDYQYSPLPAVQRWSELPPSTPLFESIVAFENYPAEMTAVSEARTIRITDVRPTERTNYPLTLQVAVAEQLSLRLIYDAERFEGAAIAPLIGHFVRLLEQMIADAGQPLAALSLLSQAERELIAGFNATTAAYPQTQCLHELFAAQAACTPEAVALIDEEQTLSYGALERRANQLAHHLRSLGVGPDVVVGLCVERSLDMVVGLLGILKAGGAYVPLDPALPEERLAFMLEDCAPVALLTQSTVAERLPATSMLRVLILDDPSTQTLLAQQPADNLDPVSRHLTPSHLAYVIYTSGSTGTAKGVMIEHRSAVNFWQVLRRTTHSRCPPHARIGVNSAFSF